MSDVLTARGELARLAGDLRQASDWLAQVSRELEPVQEEYDKFVDEFELGLLLRSESEEDYKLPSQALRLKLARRGMDADLLGRFMGLTNKRERLVQRIRDLKAQIDAQRSLVSAAKAEMEATS